MLSKKMAVSLTSLIAILLLAFSAAEEVHAQSTFKVVVADMDGSGVSQIGATLLDSIYEISEPPEHSLPNLLEFFRHGGRLLVYSNADVVVSEIMWGVDASLNPSSDSQWIEVKNIAGVPNPKIEVQFIPINRSPNPLSAEAVEAGATLRDTVSTYDSATKLLWPIETKGQSGRTGTGEAATGVTTVVSTTALVSMQRVYETDAQVKAVDGTSARGWRASTGIALNFDKTAIGERVGTPGAAPLVPVVKEQIQTVSEVKVPTAGADDISITEIMVDTADGRLPQWIELTSSAAMKVSLAGWKMVIDNAIDADVVGGGNAITLNLSGVLDVSAHAGNIGEGQSIVVAAWTAGNVRASKNIRNERVIILSSQLGQKARYQLLSYDGFRITLVPPNQGAIAAFGDIVGNLDEDWEIPMDVGAARSSMIRREMDAAGMATLGTDANGWTLASTTSLITGQESYFGDDEDAGTPGQDAGGPLPVELSHFRPARDKATGQVVITWATESELNNAGFFIKRSQQRNGQFVVVNPTMIPGAGTTSEKQFYTYTDTTAQPNVVYYYQIEDVSLDGNHQRLTRGIRLKGHIGAAGKATVIWGELKSSNE